MDVQTLLLWAARLACPLTIGAMLWFMLRQSNTAPEPRAKQRLAELQRHRAAVDHEIEVVEAQVDQGATGGRQPKALENS